MFAKFLYLLIFIHSFCVNDGKSKSVAKEKEFFGNMSPDYFNNDMAEQLDKRRDDIELFYLDPNMQMLDTEEDSFRASINATRNIRILLPDDEIDQLMRASGILTTTSSTTKKPKSPPVIRNRTVVIRKKLKSVKNETKVEKKVEKKVDKKGEKKGEKKVDTKVDTSELKELKEIANFTKILNIITNRLIRISESFEKKGCNVTKFEAFKDDKNGTKRAIEYKQGLVKIKEVLKKFSRNQSCCNFTLKDKGKVGKVRKARGLDYINIEDIMKIMNVTPAWNNKTNFKFPNQTMRDANYTNFLRSKDSGNISSTKSKFNISRIFAETSTSTPRTTENVTSTPITPSNTSTTATSTTRVLTTTFASNATTLAVVTLPTDIQTLLSNVSNISTNIQKPIETNSFVKPDYSDFLDQINKYITQAINQISTTSESPTTPLYIFSTEKENIGKPVKKSIDANLEQPITDNSTVKKETANETHSLVFFKELYNFNKTGKVLHVTIDKVTNTTRQLVNISVSLDQPENHTLTTIRENITTPETTSRKIIYQNYVFSPRYVNIGNFFFNTPKKPKGSFPSFFKRKQMKRKKFFHANPPTTPSTTTTTKDTLEGYIKSLRKITALWEKLIKNFSFSLKKSSEEDDVLNTPNRNISYSNITHLKKTRTLQPFSEKYFIKPSTLLLKEPSNKYLVINVSSGSIFPINESLVPTFLNTLRRNNGFRAKKKKYGRKRLSYINPPFTSDLSGDYERPFKKKKAKLLSISDSSYLSGKSTNNDDSGYSDIVDRQFSDASENQNVIKDFEYQIDQVRSLKKGPLSFQKRKYKGLRNHTVDIRSSRVDSSKNYVDKTRGRKFMEKGKIRHRNASNVSDIDFLRKIGVNPVLAKMIGKLDLSDMYALLNIIQEEGDENLEKRSSEGFTIDDLSSFAKTDPSKATEDSVRDSLNYLGAFSKYIENKTSTADPQFYAQKLLGILNQLDLGNALKSDAGAGIKMSNESSREHPVFKFTKYFDNSIKAFKKTNPGKRPRRKRNLNYSLDSIPALMKRPSYIRSFFAKKGGKRLLQKRPSWVRKLIKPLPKIKSKNIQKPDISHKTFIQNVQNTTDVILNYMSSMLDLLQEMYKRNQFVPPTQATYDSISLLTKDFMAFRNNTNPVSIKPKIPDADEDQKYLTTLLHFLAKDIQKFGNGLRHSKINLNNSTHSFDSLWTELKTIASDYFNSKLNKTDKNLTIPKEFYAGYTRIPKRLNIELERYAEMKQPDSDYLWHVNKIEEEEMDSKQADLDRQKNRKIFYIYSPASSNGILKKGPCVSNEEQIFFHFIPSRTYVKNEAKILGDTILNNIRKNNRIAVICGRNIAGANELANIFASRYGKQKHSDVIWINAETNETTTNDLSELLNMLDLKHCYKENRTHHSVYLDLLFDYFSKRTGLFILSNIKPWNILLQNRYFVNGDLLNVILTSDKRNWAGDLFEVIELSKYGLKVSNNHNDSNDNWDFFRQHPEILGTVNNFA